MDCRGQDGQQCCKNESSHEASCSEKDDGFRFYITALHPGDRPMGNAMMAETFNEG
jgi:hypothetical protein